MMDTTSYIERFRLSGEGSRRLEVTVLAWMLLVGYLLPVAMKGDSGVEWEWICFTVFTAEHVPLVLRLLFLHPCLAGAVLLGMRRSRYRAETLLLLWFLPILLPLFNEKMFEGMMKTMAGVTTEAGWWWAALSTLGWLGMFIGSRVRSYRPRSVRAFQVAFIGGGLFLLGAILPVLPKEAGWFPIWSPVVLMQNPNTRAAGSVYAVQMAFWVIAAAFALFNTPRRADAEAQNIAGVTWLLALAGLALSAVGIFLAIVLDRGGSVPVFPLVVVTVKFTAWIVGYALLLPMGISEGIIKQIPPPREEIPLSGGDDSPSPDVLRMRRLKRAWQRGEISQEEFERRKQEVLDELMGPRTRPSAGDAPTETKPH